MISFKSVLKKFDRKGEKTGWTYIEISQTLAEKLLPNCKKSFRVKGNIDGVEINKIALVPMGEGNFIMAVNSTLRKAIKKIHGKTVVVSLQHDDIKIEINEELLACLADDPESMKYFNSLPASHQNWFSNWVTAAKTNSTMVKRIATTIEACSQKMDYPTMMKEYKKFH